MATLSECIACGRHVRQMETRCPFCAAAMICRDERAVPPLPSDRRLTRAAFVFAGAAVVAGCGKTAASTDPQPQPPPTLPAPAYGPPPVDLSQGSTDAGSPQPQAVPAYGAPPVEKK